MTRFTRETKTRKHVKQYGFLQFARNLSNKFRTNIGTVITAELDATKTASNKLVHKTTEAVRKLIRYNIAERIVKTKRLFDVNSRKF